MEVKGTVSPCKYKMIKCVQSKPMNVAFIVEIVDTKIVKNSENKTYELKNNREYREV